MGQRFYGKDMLFPRLIIFAKIESIAKDAESLGA